MNHKEIVFGLLLLSTIAIFPISIQCQTNNQARVNPAIKTSKAVMEGFMAKRFGMFIHFGPVTLRGTEIGWSRNNEVAQDDYDSLYKEFDPVLFNAEDWVRAAKNAGMKYLTITSKHHDGFCLWPTSYSKYNISNTPFKRDIVAELARACQHNNIKFCIYFTVLDWHDPNYPIHNPHHPIYDSTADMRKFIHTMKGELKELVTRYHPYMLWFDGNWESPWTLQDGVEIYTYLKSLDPNVIINNRLGKGDHKLSDESMVGDYLTPEQEIGNLDMEHPWETCMTIGNQWSWKPNDQIKSSYTLIQTLVRSAAGNGNFLLNLSPMMDGRMEQRQIKRIKEVGDWLKLNGSSIFETKGGPYVPNKIFASTRKGNKVFIHILSDNLQQIDLAPLPDLKILKAHLMNGGSVNFSITKQGEIHLSWDSDKKQNPDTIIVLELNGDSESIAVIK